LGDDVSVIKQLKQSELKQLRNNILLDQDGRCPICRRQINEYEICLDHEHKKKVKGTGQIRGVLCRACNTFLGKMENNCRRYGISRVRLPNFLSRTADYLREDHKPFIHPSEKEKAPKLMKSSYNSLKANYSGKAKFPGYPKSGILTVKLKTLFREYGIRPKFYGR